MTTYAIMYDQYESSFDPPRFAVCSENLSPEIRDIFNEHTIKIKSSSFTDNHSDISKTLHRLGYNNFEILEL